MSSLAYSESLLRDALTKSQVIAVVGLSPNPGRPSFDVARFLQQKGHRVLPVNPGHAGKQILGETVYSSLGTIPASIGKVQMVDIFRRSEHAGAIVDEALEVLADRGLGFIWMQLGVIDHAAAKRAEASGISVIMDRCPKIEYGRLMLGQQGEAD